MDSNSTRLLMSITVSFSRQHWPQPLLAILNIWPIALLADVIQYNRLKKYMQTKDTPANRIGNSWRLITSLTVLWERIKDVFDRKDILSIGGIHFIAVMLVHEQSWLLSNWRNRLSTNFAGVRRMVLHRGSLRRLSQASSLVWWFYLSDISRAQELAYGNGAHSLRDLRAQNIRHCRHNISGNKEASQVVVPSDVVRNKSKVWG